MLKKTQVCACKFVHPQKVSLSAEGTVLSPRRLGTVSKPCFYLRRTWWELEDGKREHLLAYEVDKRHVAAGNSVLTPKPAPLVCSGQQKSHYEYHRLAASLGEGCFWTTFSSHSPSAQLAEHSSGGNQKSWLASQGESCVQNPGTVYTSR